MHPVIRDQSLIIQLKTGLHFKGREQNGWTAIQFKRLLDTCYPTDYPIKIRDLDVDCHFNVCFSIMQSGTNNLIFAYGLINLDPSQPDSVNSVRIIVFDFENICLP
jgi:hypothetical protein